MNAEETSRWRVLEVHNFGGFFGGDTVTLTAARCDDGVEETITIDEKALRNMNERHAVAPDMVFDLLMAGERVDRAELLGASEWAVLQAALALEAPPELADGPSIRAYRCDACALWVVGTPDVGAQGARCALCASHLRA